jgi:hypothetical protein
MIEDEDELVAEARLVAEQVQEEEKLEEIK